MDIGVNAPLQIVFSLDTVCEDFELDKTERESYDEN